MKTTPTTQEIIQIMKTTCAALEQFSKKRRTNYNEETERELELWSNNLRCIAATLNNRIINK